MRKTLFMVAALFWSITLLSANSVYLNFSGELDWVNSYITAPMLFICAICATVAAMDNKYLSRAYWTIGYTSFTGAVIVFAMNVLSKSFCYPCTLSGFRYLLIGVFALAVRGFYLQYKHEYKAHKTKSTLDGLKNNGG